MKFHVHTSLVTTGEHLRGLSLLPDGQPLSVSLESGRPLISSVFFLGLCPRYPGFVEETHSSAPMSHRLCPELKCDEEGRLVPSQPVKWFPLQYFCLDQQFCPLILLPMTIKPSGQGTGRFSSALPLIGPLTLSKPLPSLSPGFYLN